MWNPFSAVKNVLIKKVGEPIVEKELEAHLPFIGKFIAWFNAEPGRRRGASAFFGLLAAGLKGFGLASWAAGVAAFVPFLDLLVPGASIISIAFGLWSVIAQIFPKVPAPPSA